MDIVSNRGKEGQLGPLLLPPPTLDKAEVPRYPPALVLPLPVNRNWGIRNGRTAAGCLMKKAGVDKAIYRAL